MLKRIYKTLKISTFITILGLVYINHELTRIVHAVKPSEMLDNPILEKRARSLSDNLRCVVCKNQSIDESDAPLAQDLRMIIRIKLKEGYTDEQIYTYLVERYGEFVLLKPKITQHTFILWFFPFIFAIISLICISIWYKRKT